jgi:hypothetical protein
LHSFHYVNPPKDSTGDVLCSPLLMLLLHTCRLDHCRIGVADGPYSSNWTSNPSFSTYVGSQTYNPYGWSQTISTTFIGCQSTDYVKSGNRFVMSGSIPSSWASFAPTLKTLWVQAPCLHMIIASYNIDNDTFLAGGYHSITFPVRSLMHCVYPPR